MMNKILSIIILLLITHSAVAQTDNATSLGFANNYRPYASGVDAFKTNPGRLAYNEGLQFTFLSFSTAVSNSGFSVSNLNQYFSEEGHGGEWSTADKNEVLDIVSEIGVQADVGLNIFSMAVKNFGFGIDLVSNGGALSTSEEIAEIALFGLDLTTDYNLQIPDVATGSFFSAIKYSFAYSQQVMKRFYPLQLKNITAAGKINYYQGLATAEIIDSDAKIKRSSLDNTVENEVVEYTVNFKARTSSPENGITAGKGMGIDLASSATFMNDWHFSLLLENVVGFINWDGNPELVIGSFSDSTYLDNSKKNDEKDRSVETDTTKSTKAFSTRLPANLYIGAHYQLLENLALTAQYKQGLSESFGNTFTPQIGVGAEYRPVPIVPLRMGMTVGGRNTFLLGLGTGLDLGGFQFNLSVAMREGLWPTHSNGVFFAWDFKILH